MAASSPPNTIYRTKPPKVEPKQPRRWSSGSSETSPNSNLVPNPKQSLIGMHYTPQAHQTNKKTMLPTSTSQYTSSDSDSSSSPTPSTSTALPASIDPNFSSTPGSSKSFYKKTAIKSPSPQPPPSLNMDSLTYPKPPILIHKPSESSPPVSQLCSPRSTLSAPTAAHSTSSSKGHLPNTPRPFLVQKDFFLRQREPSESLQENRGD